MTYRYTISRKDWRERITEEAFRGLETMLSREPSNGEKAVFELLLLRFAHDLQHGPHETEQL